MVLCFDYLEIREVLEYFDFNRLILCNYLYFNEFLMIYL